MQEKLWGAYRGYGEAELVANRASLLLYGGSATERRAWAEEAQRHFAVEGPLREVTNAEQLAAALEPGRGVVFLVDACALGLAVQGQLMRFLQQREERPKVIVGMPVPPAAALDRGLLREDLLYKLQVAQVDLSVAETREAVRLRRQQEAERRASELANAPEKATVSVKQKPTVKVAKTVVKVPSRKAEKKPTP